MNLPTENAELQPSDDIFGPEEAAVETRESVPAKMAIDPDELPLPAAPFRGIKPFRLVDWRIFFEREKQTEQTENLMVMYRAVLLFGRSGCGKSSLIDAGLTPRALRRYMTPERIRVRPYPNNELSVERIALSETARDPTQPSNLRNYLPSRFSDADIPERLELSCADFLAQLRRKSDLGTPLLIFDQFEELITLFEAGAEASDGFRQAKKARIAIEHLLDELILHAEDRVKLIFAFRDDYLARLSGLFERYPHLLDQSVRLESPEIDRLPSIVLGPFERASRGLQEQSQRWNQPRFTKELVDRIKEGFEVLSPGGHLALSEVQTLCEALWDKPGLRGQLLTAKQPHLTIRKIIEEEAWAKVKGYSRLERIHALALLASLVTKEGTRNVISEGNLLREARSNPALWFFRANTRKVLARMVETTGLLRLSSASGNKYYELQSEFLIPWVQNAQKGMARVRKVWAIYVWGVALAFLLWFAGLWLNAQALNQQLKSREAQLTETNEKLLDAQKEVKRANESNQTAVRQQNESTRILREQAQAAEKALQEVALILLQKAPDELESLSSSIRELVQAQIDARGKVIQPATMDPPVVLPHENDVWRAVFSADGKQVATASADKFVKLWRLDGTAIIQPWQASASAGGVTDIAIDPKGRFLISGSAGRSVRVYDLERNAQVENVSEAQRDTITAVAFSSNGEYAISASADQTVALWQTEAFKHATKKIEPVTQWIHRGTVTSAAFSPSGRWVVTSCDDGFVRLWDTAQASNLPRQWFARGPVRRATFNPASTEIDVLGVAGRTAFFWAGAATTNDASVFTADDEMPGTIQAIFSPDGTAGAVATADGKVRIWDLTQKHLWTLLQTRQRGRILCLAWSSNNVLAAAGEDGTVQFWRQPAQNTEPYRKFPAHQGPVWWVSFSPDGSHLATTSAFSTENLPSLISSPAELSADVKRLSHVSDNTARIWKVP